MRKVTVDHVQDKDGYATGFIGCVEPPVSVSEEAVARFIRHGNLEGAPSEDNESITRPMLLGDNGTQTRIYATLEPGYDVDIAQELFGSRITGLLGHLGIESEIQAETSI